MWVFSKSGFVSIVKHRTKYNTMLVRARVYNDLHNFRSLLGAPRDIVEMTDADYRFRMEASATDVCQAMAALARDIDYDNFKSAVHGEPDRDGAYMDVWSAMAGLQLAGELDDAGD